MVLGFATLGKGTCIMKIVKTNAWALYKIVYIDGLLPFEIFLVTFEKSGRLLYDLLGTIIASKAVYEDN